jgi:competence protein ComEC
MKRKVCEYILLKYEQFLKSVRDITIFYGILLLSVLGLAFLLTSFSIFDTFIPNKTVTVTFYDVGQGDGIFIESGAKTKVLIDGGPSRIIVEKVDRELSFFDRTIDLVAPSHADKDHITGALAVLDRFPVRFTAEIHASTTTELDDEYTTRALRTSEVRSLAGDGIDIGGGAKLAVLLPKEGEFFFEKETNESSSVLLLTYGPFSFLFTGDLPETREKELIKSGKLPRNLTALKIGHHGSKFSSGSELLYYTKPKYVIVSAGSDNSYGHPSKEVLERVEKVKSRVLRTDEMGDISFVMKGNKLEVKKEK